MSRSKSALYGLTEMSIELDKFFQERSPFLPEFDQSILYKIERDLDPSCPGEAIAKHLLFYVASSQVGDLLINLREINKKFKMDPVHIGHYTSGFYRPLRTLQISYIGASDGVESAKYALRSASGVELPPDELFVAMNLNNGIAAVKEDPSGKLLVNSLVDYATAHSENQFYKVGVEAARRTFNSYLNRIKPEIKKEGPAHQNKGIMLLVPYSMMEEREKRSFELEHPEIKNKRVVVHAMNIAKMRVSGSDLEGAARYARAALELSRELGDLELGATSADLFADIAEKAGYPDLSLKLRHLARDLRS